MPASGIFISAIAQIKAAVTALGYKPVTCLLYTSDAADD